MIKILILIFIFSMRVGAELPQYEIFKPNSAKFNQIGFPRFLQDNPNFDLVFGAPYLYGFLNRVGSGVHIGDGYILTARHVYANTDAKLEKSEFNGHKKIRHGLFDGNDLVLKQLPIPTEADIKVINGGGSRWEDVHLYNDWALMQDLSYKGRTAFTKVRGIDSLRSGEALWIIGNPFGNPPVQIAVGHFSKKIGRVSLIVDVDLMRGFSGGPVVDTEGNLVGIIYAFNSQTREATFMNADDIYKSLKINKNRDVRKNKTSTNLCARSFT